MSPGDTASASEAGAAPSRPTLGARRLTHAERMTRLAQLLVLSSTHGAGPVLPSLELLSHRVRQIPAEPASLVNAPSADVIFVDAIPLGATGKVQKNRLREQFGDHLMAKAAA